MKSNILYLHETSKFAGAEESLLNLAKFLDKGRFTPNFILPEEGLLKDKLEAIGVKVFVVPMPKIRRVVGVIPAARRILSIARENNISLLHTNSIRTHFYGLHVARKLKLPIIWHQRNLLTRELLDPDRLFSSLADVIICNSCAVARRFLKKGTLSDKVRVVYNGVDTERFSPAISPDRFRREFGIGESEKIVGIASRFDKRKGHEDFFKAAKEVIRLEKNVRFLVVGGAVFDNHEEREQYLRDRVKSLDLKDRVIFSGFRQDMPEVYAAIDIFVLPSLQEACARVLLEAMASGKPVIATSLGGNPEIVVDEVTGILVPAKDARALAQAMLRLIREPDTARQMGEAGRKRIQECFTIAENLVKIEFIYGELLNKYGA